MITIIISFIVGIFFGMFAMALCVIVKQSDKKAEDLMRNHFNNSNPKQTELF